ncbi:MAG: hypothetical protein ACLRWM_05215 [Streptococcus sp.]
MDISFDIASFLFLFVYQYDGLRSDEPSLVSRNSWYLSFCTLQNDCQLSSKKVSELKLSYIKAFSHLFLLVIFLLVGIFIIFRLDLNTSFLVLNIMLLLFGICSEELIRLFRSAEMLDARDYVKVLFLKRNRMVKSLLANEDTEQQFSEFLHNEILQNVMAIKISINIVAIKLLVNRSIW